jgi:hypothetical protein
MPETSLHLPLDLWAGVDRRDVALAAHCLRARTLPMAPLARVAAALERMEAYLSPPLRPEVAGASLHQSIASTAPSRAERTGP